MHNGICMWELHMLLLTNETRASKQTSTRPGTISWYNIQISIHKILPELLLLTRWCL